MDPVFMFENPEPTNRFPMEGLNMAYAAELTHDGQPLSKLLFLDIMTEKTQMLIDHLKHLQLGLSLVANISENGTTVKIYDNYTVDSLKLHITISNLWDIEDQLYRLWIEVNGVIHDYMPALI